MEIKTLENISFAELTATFNLAFSDYIISFKLTETAFAAKVLGDNIDLSLSPGFFENGTLSGFIFHGVGERKGQPVIWNGGTGVVPEHRGKGVTNQLYKFILPKLRNKGFDQTVLEVIEGNDPAIHIYKKNGFEIIRQLECYKGSMQTSPLPSGIIFKKIEEIDWKVFHGFRNWEPTFQNNDVKINLIKEDVVARGAFENEVLIGYIIYGKSKEEGNIYQFAVKESHRRKGIGKALFSIAGKDKTVPLKANNVDQRDKETNAFLIKNGFEKVISQFEMLKKL